jgi:hypothetical protein
MRGGEYNRISLLFYSHIMSLETQKIESIDSSKEIMRNPMDVTENKDLRAM